jgi:hypothetical protein
MKFQPLPAYAFLTDPAKPLGSRRFRAAFGGRGAAKSWEFVNAALLHASTLEGLRVVFAREVQSNLEESSFELVRSRLDHYGLLHDYFIENKGTFEGRHGQKIMFKGLWKGNKPEGVKSMEGIDLTILEEATEVRQRSLDVLVPTIMRTPRSELWALWNPTEPDAPIDKFFRGAVKPPKSEVWRTSWRDNPAFPSALAEIKDLDYAKGHARAEWIWGGEYMPSIEGAIWNRETLDQAWRLGQRADLSQMTRVVVGVDPSGGGDDVGIVVAGQLGDKAIVLADMTCKATSPLAWATQVGKACQIFNADCVVAESNYGGDMVKSTLRTGNVTARVKMVVATKGKQVRAEPIAALYDADRVLHREPFALMEAEMTLTTPAGYQGSKSPNRMDALVWAITELMLGNAAPNPSIRRL